MTYIPKNPQYAEMYAYEKSIAFNITVADTYHPLCLITAGDIVAGMLSGWTFYAGRVVDSNIVQEFSGTKLGIQTSAPHGLTTGDLVVLGNMNNAGHNKPTRVTVDGLDTFTCDDINYVAGAGASAGTVKVPAYLKAGANSAGNYTFSATIDGAASNINKDWKWEVNVEITPKDNMVSERNSTATLASVPIGGHTAISVGDRVWLSGKNITDTTDYTIKNFNLHLHKI